MENYEDIINSKVNEELDKIKFKFKELGYEWRDEYSFIFRQGALIGAVRREDGVVEFAAAGVLIQLLEIGAVKGHALSGGDLVGNVTAAAGGGVQGIIRGVGGQGGLGHLGGGQIALAAVQGGGAGVLGGPALEGVGLAAAAGFGRRAGRGGGGALFHALGLEGLRAVHESDGDGGGARGIAAGIALAVVIQVHMTSQVVLVAADGALVPVVAGVVLHGAAVHMGLVGGLGAAVGAFLPVGNGVFFINGGPLVVGRLNAGTAAGQAGALVLLVVQLLPGAPVVMAAVRRQGGGHQPDDQCQGQQGGR